MPKPIHRGRVRFSKSRKGWGGIESDETPGDVSVHLSIIDGDRYRELVEGETVEFRQLSTGPYALSSA
jgi:cold shock CspA family protein